MTTQTTSISYVPSATLRPPIRRALGGSAVAAVAGAVVLFGYGAIAIAIHGPMNVGSPGDPTPITAVSFSIGVLFSSFFGILLAVALARWATRPATTFERAGIALTVVSLWAPLTAQTDESTRLFLAVGHVVAACVVIPLIMRSLRTRLV
jgi:uncharacterized protein DUF6069